VSSSDGYKVRHVTNRREAGLDTAYISAFFGLAGMTLGSVMSFATSWMTQQAQLREKRREAETATRQRLFAGFIAEASRLYGDALSHQKDDVTDLVKLYALVARMRLVASPAVVAAAEQVMDTIIETYLAPNLTLHELRALARQDGMNFLVEFSEACRAELQRDLLADRAG